MMLIFFPLTRMEICPRLVLGTIGLLLVIQRIEGMHYEEALEVAKSSEVDEYESNLISAFRQEHMISENAGDLVRLRNIKVNLASLFLLFANKKKDPSSYIPMYDECVKISKENIKLFIKILIL